MKTIELAVSQIIPYENNPRFNDGAVDAVAKSIQEFGFQQPLVLDKDYVVIVGHTRLKAAKRLGLETVPCVIADKLTDEQVKAYRLADNKVGELAEWDFELLAGELDEIMDIDMSDFGFDLEFAEDEESTEVTEDDYETEVPAEPKAKLGDIYQLGRHRLMCGDSTDKETVEMLMDGKKADMVFTDPPYGMRLDTDYSEIKGSKNAKIKGKGGNKYRPVI